MTLLDDAAITAGLTTLSGWTLSEDKTSISTSVELVDFVAALDLAQRINDIAGIDHAAGSDDSAESEN